VRSLRSNIAILLLGQTFTAQLLSESHLFYICGSFLFLIFIRGLQPIKESHIVNDCYRAVKKAGSTNYIKKTCLIFFVHFFKFINNKIVDKSFCGSFNLSIK
jgi:hypothetical protein